MNLDSAGRHLTMVRLVPLGLAEGNAHVGSQVLVDGPDPALGLTHLASLTDTLFPRDSVWRHWQVERDAVGRSATCGRQPS